MLRIKNKLKVNGVLILLIGSFLKLSCMQTSERNFFNKMRAYPDIKIEGSSYFIKNFGLSNKSHKIHEKLYWKLNCDKGSYFYLSGYLRMLNDSVVILPIEAENKSLDINEMKLFDFSEKLDSNWFVFFEQEGKMLYGDSIRFLGVSQQDRDSVSTFEMYPFYYYRKSNTRSYLDHWFKLNVSKSKGILNITAFGNDRFDTLFYFALIPGPIFLDKRDGELRL